MHKKTLKAKNMTLSDWTSLYGREATLDATCTLFPEFKNIKGVIKSASRSKQNPNVFIIYINIKKQNDTVKQIKVDSGMSGLTVTT